MYLGSCIILLCLGHFHILLINATGDKLDRMTLPSRMYDEFKKISIRHEAECAGESSRSDCISNDSEDEVVIVRSSQSNIVRYFNPVDIFWQYGKCKQFNLQLENYFQFNQRVKILNTPSRWVEVEGDGNCFYRALSVWVSGTEENHLIIRLHVLEIVRNDQRIVEFMGKANYREHLIWLSKNSWSTEVEIVAATILLNTSIYVYSQHKHAWDLFDQNQTTKGPLAKTDKCIYIQHVSKTHYNLVTDVEPDQDQGYNMAATLDHNIKNVLSIGISEAENLLYYPVGEVWQDEKCLKWNLKLEKPFHYFKTSFLNTPKICVEIQKDRNCFFRALSYWVTGTEDNHQIIRQYVVEEIFLNHAIQELYDTNEFLNFKVQNNWATKVEIIASAVLLNTSIFIYSHDKKTWDLYSKNVVVNVTVDTTTDRSIYLRQMSPNEFDVVEDVEDYFEVSNYYNKRL